MWWLIIFVPTVQCSGAVISKVGGIPAQSEHIVSRDRNYSGGVPPFSSCSERNPHQFRQRFRASLLHDRCTMIFDCALADPEICSDILAWIAI